MVSSDQLKILEPLYERLLANCKNDDHFVGALYGLSVDGVKIVVAAAGHPFEQGDRKQELKLLNEMIPCGIEPMGVFGLGLSCDQLLGVSSQLPPPTDEGVTPLVLSVMDNKLLARSCQSGQLGDILEVGTMSVDEYKDLVTVIRVRGKLELNCGLTLSEVSNAFRCDEDELLVFKLVIGQY